MAEIDVIFLSAARHPPLRDLTQQAVSSLLASEPSAQVVFHPLVIESCPENVPRGYIGARTITLPGPFGYHRSMNHGVAHGAAEYVCMCNNDLFFHPGWATEMLAAFAADPGLMSASPYCQYFHGSRLPDPGERTIAGYVNGVHATGWCLFVRRALFYTIGKLDERFCFWYCDDDYRMTLQDHRIRHVLVTGSRVDHLESQTINSERDLEMSDRITARQRLLFDYKWRHRSRVIYGLKLLKYIVRRRFSRDNVFAETKTR